MPKRTESEHHSALEPEEIMRTLGDVQQAGLGSLSWLGTKWVETMSDMGAEWLSFVAERVREDIKTQHELMHAKDFAQVQHIQASFLQKAMNDYRDETGRMIQFCNDAMADIHEKAQKDKGAKEEKS